MRWVVELPAEGGGTGATITADGESWKAALGVARSGKPLPKFRCDFDEDGTVRVWDMVTNERFVLKPLSAAPTVPTAPEPSPVTASAAPSPPEPDFKTTAVDGTPIVAPAPVAMPAAPSPEASPSPSPPTSPAPSASNGTPASAAMPAPMAAATPGVPPALTDVPSPAALLFQRNREPSSAAPLSYRERVLAVPDGTSAVVAERVAREVWQSTRRALLAQPPGQYVSIAVFDHRFHSRPERAPLVVLNWKDWRGDDPEITFPINGHVKSVPPAVTEPARPVSKPPPSAAPESAPRPSTPSMHAVSAPTPDIASVRAHSTPPPASAIAPASTPSTPAMPAVPMPRVPSTPPPPSNVALAKTTSSPGMPAVTPPAAAAAAASPAEPTPAVPLTRPSLAQPDFAATLGYEQRPPTQAPIPAPTPAPEQPAPTPAVPVPSATPAPLSGTLAYEQAPPAPTAAPAAVAVPATATVAHEQPAAPAAVPVAAVTPPPAPSTPPGVAPFTGTLAYEQKPAAQPAGFSATLGYEQATPAAAPLLGQTIATTPSPATQQSVPPAGGRTRKASRPPLGDQRGPRRGEELLTYAFESMQDLAFLNEPSEACNFVSTVIRELLPGSSLAVMVYDIDRDELVVLSAHGLGEILGRRAPLAVGPRGEAAIRNKTIVLSDRWDEDPLVKPAPAGPVMFLPARHDRRLFAVLQVHRADVRSFDEDEEHTVAYLATQLASFLADHSKRIGFDDEPKKRR